MWKPGQSGNPLGIQAPKPWLQALSLEYHALNMGQKAKHPPGSLRWNAQKLLLNATPQAFQQIADRLDGKVPQQVVGGDESTEPIKHVVTWKQPPKP